VLVGDFEAEVLVFGCGTMQSVRTGLSSFEIFFSPLEDFVRGEVWKRGDARGKRPGPISSVIGISEAFDLEM